MAHSFNSLRCISGLPGLPSFPSDTPLPARKVKKNPGTESPGVPCPAFCPSAKGFPVFQGYGKRQGARSIGTVSGIWFLILGLVAV